MTENVTSLLNQTTALLAVSSGRDLTTDEKLLFIEAARQFALERHGDALHGQRPYGDHLEQVAFTVQTTLGDAARFWPVVSAAWLHDTVEDTETTVKEIERYWGATTAGLVDYVTDQPGKNRRERHLNTYWRIRQCEHSVLIKLADRLSNQSLSLRDRTRFVTMYFKEYMNFKFALYRPDQWPELWADLDKQYEQMAYQHVHGDR